MNDSLPFLHHLHLSETSQHLLRASYEPGLRLLFLLQFPQHPLEVGRQYSHPRFTDEITEARQSTSPRAMTSLTAELLKSNSLQEIWLGHCSDTARPLPASVSHLGEGAAPLEVPCRSRAGCCSCRPLGLHAQLRWLASLGSALFCFCCWTYYRRTPGSAAEHSRGFLFRSVPGRVRKNRKGGQGPTGRSHRNSA